jgi:hypothetical protein
VGGTVKHTWRNPRLPWWLVMLIVIVFVVVTDRIL